MLPVCTFDSIKFIFCTVHFILAKEFILCADLDCHSGQALRLDAGTFRDQLTLEYSVNSDASIVAERDWFCPCKALLEEDVFKISGDKRVFNRVTIVIKSLHHVSSPAFVQS